MADVRERKNLTSNMEDYLEAIYVIGQENQIVRIKDISDLLGVKKSSVNSAVKVLSSKGLVKHEKYGYVALTTAGQKTSKAIKKRHDLLIRFLEEVLKIDRKTAKNDACKIEHVISFITNDRLNKFIEFIDTCPTGETPEWLDGFEYFVKNGKRPGKCFPKKRG